MTDNLSIIKDSKHIIKSSSAELCNSYNDLCGGKCADAILSVLDGELRMAVKLKQLENFFSKTTEQQYASECEILDFKNKEE